MADNITPKWMQERQRKAAELAKKYNELSVIVSSNWADNRYSVTFDDLCLDEAEHLAIVLMQTRRRIKR